MRKKIYHILKAMRHGDIISVFTCKLEGQSNRVRTEIYELRYRYKIQIITVEGFVGRCAAYFLDESKENLERVDYLLKKYEKKNISSSL